MSSNVHKYGFRFHRSLTGRDNPDPLEYTVADAYQATKDAGGTNVDLNIGDPVKLVNDGTVALANTTDLVYGIIVGVRQVYDSALGALKPFDRVPGGSTGGGLYERKTRVMVQPAKGVIWEIDANSAAQSTEAAYETYIHNNVEHVCPGDTNVSGRPKADPMIDIANAATTAGLGWRIVGISKSRENRDFSTNYVKFLVVVNDSSEAGSAATNVAGV